MADAPAPVAPDPIQTGQKWQNEYGFIDSFSSPNVGTGMEAAKRGLIGLGSGAAGGAFLGHNPWYTGVNTGLGAGAGHLLATLLTKGMKDTGAATAYNSAGSLAGAGLGFGLSTLGKDPDDKKKYDLSIPLPAGAQFQLKTGGVGDFLNKAVKGVQRQLPQIRGFDTAVGGALGAGGGAIYDAVQDDTGASEKEKKRRLWHRLIGGAGIGALGANVVGDRTRRYISNNMVPYGYDPSASHVSLKPKGVKHLVDSAILDKPQQPAVQDFEAGKYQAPYTRDDRVPFGNSSLNISARRELMRRGFGVHTDDTAKDIWAKQPDGSVSLNPGHPNAESNVREMMYPGPNEMAFHKYNLTDDPVKAVSRINSEFDGGETPGMMQEVVGGQRVGMYPYKNEGNGKPEHLMKIQDRWDFGLDTGEKAKFMDYLKQKYIKRDPKAKLTLPSQYQGQIPEKEYLNSNVKRLAMEHVLMKDAPWVSQRAYFRNISTPTPNYLEGGLDNKPTYAMIPATAGGVPYKGNTIGVANPKDSDLGFVGSDKLQSLFENKFQYPPEMIPKPPQPRVK